jgi:predicted Zn-dependent protease
MRKALALLAIIVVLVSCSSTRKTTTSGTPSPVTTSPAAANSGNDGSNYEKAIFIDKKNETDGVAEEYKWLRKNYPGYTMISQSLQHKDKKSYDILHIKTKEGEEKNIYFDITQFFGKF